MAKDDTKAVFPISKGFFLASNKEELRIERRWYHPVFRWILGLGLLGLGLGVGLAAWLFSLQIPPFFYVLPAFLFLCGFALFYYGLCGYLNRAVVRIEAPFFYLFYSPLWWWGQQKVPLSEVQEVFIIKKGDKSGNKVFYDLKLQKKDKKELSLLRNLAELDDARFLMEKINKFMQS